MNRVWRGHKTIFFVCSIIFVMALTIELGTAYAWYKDGCVFCDANQNKQIDSSDIPLENVGVNIENTAGTFTRSDVTNSTESIGCFRIDLRDDPDSYIETLDETTLPADASYVIPESGGFLFTTTAGGG